MTKEEKSEPLMSRAMQGRVSCPVLTLGCCVNLSKLLSLSGPQFPCLQNQRVPVCNLTIKGQKDLGVRLVWAVRCSQRKNSGVFLLPNHFLQTKVQPAEGGTWENTPEQGFFSSLAWPRSSYSSSHAHPPIPCSSQSLLKLLLCLSADLSLSVTPVALFIPQTRTWDYFSSLVLLSMVSFPIPGSPFPFLALTHQKRDHCFPVPYYGCFQHCKNPSQEALSFIQWYSFWADMT